jgi:hypothetical protein
MRARSLLAAVAPLVLAAPLAGQQKPVTPAPAATPAATPVAPKPAVPKPTTVPASVPALGRAAAVLAPARRPQIEITGGIGTAVVDLGSWAGGTIASSSKLAYWGAGRVFFPVGTSISVGAELGYHYHFWWSTPSGYSWNYTYSAAAMHAAALLRLPVAPSITADVGAALHFFSAGVKPGVVGALSYRIPVGPNIVIPVGVRADAVFTNPMVLPIVLNAGVGFSL